ncbi:MAG: hypothetical protein J1F36_01070 [Clostridiales bacterium]|nr:hypothetical protein [Clostridiales bacterium]
MFYKDSKFYGEDFSFAFPNGCHIWLDFDEPDLQVIEFTKKEPNVLYHIEVVFDKISKATSLENSLLEKIDGMDCEPDSQIAPITRGRSGVAAYFHNAVSNFYEERYQVKENNEEILLSFTIWTSLLDNPDLKDQLLKINDEKYIAEHFKKVPCKRYLTSPK